MMSAAKGLSERVEGRGVAVVAIHVAQQGRESCEVLVPYAVAVFAETGSCPFAKLGECPSGFRDADDGDGQQPAAHQRLQGGKDLLVGQVSGGAEEYEPIRWSRHIRDHARQITVLAWRIRRNCTLVQVNSSGFRNQGRATTTTATRSDPRCLPAAADLAPART